MPEIEHPQKRRTISGGVRSPKEPQVWDVGVRVSNAIRNYKNHERSAEKEMPLCRALIPVHGLMYGQRTGIPSGLAPGAQSFRTGSPSSVGFHPFRSGWIGRESFPPTFIWFWKADS